MFLTTLLSLALNISLPRTNREDIAACQTQYSKIVMLSIGGATYSEGGFQSEDAAIAGARKVWETFGPPQEGSDALRPFGKSSVDGFDFDFEATVSNMVPFGNELRTLMDDAGSSSGKKYFLSAAPQCPYPDAANNEMLDGAVAFDVIWVQFYNNFCGLQNFHVSHLASTTSFSCLTSAVKPGQDPQSAFNFDVWDTWAKNTSKNKDVKVMLGVPAGQTAAGSGYLPPDSLKPVIDYCKKFASFGGVMMWDASQAVANSGFLEGIKGALDVAAAVRTAQVPMA